MNALVGIGIVATVEAREIGDVDSREDNPTSVDLYNTSGQDN